MDIIVTDRPSEVNLPGEKLTMREFLTKATNKKDGFYIQDYLYVDVAFLNEKIYGAIVDACPETKFFTVDDEKPDYIKEKILDLRKEQKIEKESNINIIDNTETVDSYSNNNKIDSNEIIEMINQNISNDNDDTNNKTARIYLFGSSKGGTGKTFTCLLTAYRYAKTHQNEKIALADFDVIDGQVGVTIHTINVSMLNYYKVYKIGCNSFKNMREFSCKFKYFPSNVDFYLAPKDGVIQDEKFWDNVFYNLIKNYDVIFLDSGIDYMNYPTISKLYLLADKVMLMTTTSIKSIASVTKQINNLTGRTKNKVFTPEDNIAPKLNLIVTQASQKNKTNQMAFDILQNTGVNLIATFGMMNEDIYRAEFLCEWNVFDNKTAINKVLDNITSFEE